MGLATRDPVGSARPLACYRHQGVSLHPGQVVINATRHPVVAEVLWAVAWWPGTYKHILCHGYPNGSPHERQQDLSAASAVETDERRDHARKRSRDQLDRAAGHQSAVGIDHAVLVGGGAQILDNSRWNRHGPIPRHDQARHAQCSVDRAPAVTLDIQGDESVAREEPGQFGVEATGVTPCDLQARNEDGEPLPQQICLRGCLSMRQCGKRIPTLRQGGRVLLLTHHQAVAIREHKGTTNAEVPVLPKTSVNEASASQQIMTKI